MRCAALLLLALLLPGHGAAPTADDDDYSDAAPFMRRARGAEGAGGASDALDANDSRAEDVASDTTTRPTSPTISNKRNSFFVKVSTVTVRRPTHSGPPAPARSTGRVVAPPVPAERASGAPAPSPTADPGSTPPAVRNVPIFVWLKVGEPGDDATSWRRQKRSNFDAEGKKMLETQYANMAKIAQQAAAASCKPSSAARLHALFPLPFVLCFLLK